MSDNNNSNLKLNESSQTSNEVYLILQKLKEKNVSNKDSEIDLNSESEIKRILKCDKKNHFEILGIPENSLDQEIKNKYKKLLKLIFPDKNKDSNSSIAFQCKTFLIN